MILLTGVTGKTGGATAKELVDKGVPLRALVRDEAKAAELKAAGVELLVGDLCDKAIVQKAMEGVEKATLILPNSEQQKDMEMQFVDLATDAGVKHVVKLSSLEAREDATTPIPSRHYEVEQYLKNSPLSWTMVRPNFFMQNLLGCGATIKSMGKFFLPLGNGTTVMMDCRDVGATIAEVLTSEGHEGKSYDISGPELLNFHEVADRFSEVLGKPIEYVNQDWAEYSEKVAPFMSSEWHLDAVRQLFSEIVEGVVPQTVTSIFKEIVGREPISLSQFIQDHIFVYQD